MVTVLEDIQKPYRNIVLPVIIINSFVKNVALIYLYLPYVSEQVELFPPQTPHASSVLLLFCLPSHPKNTGSAAKKFKK